MTEAQMRELVSATFAAAWPAARPLVPFALENEPLPTSDSFVYLTIVPTTSTQMTAGRAGTRRTRRLGWVQVEARAPAGAGSAALAALADAIRGILEMVSLPSPIAGDEPVTTQAGYWQPISVDGRWLAGLVRVPMWWAETK